MKALSIKPQYVARILSGQKRIELRSWPTKHRGPMLVCATLPDGHARCIVDITDCREYLPEDARAADSDYDPDEFLYAWIIGSVTAIAPFPVKGRLGLYEVALPSPS